MVVLPDIDFPEAPARCPGDPITLNLADLDPNATYIWTATPPDPTLTDPTVHNPTVAPLVTTTYIVSVQKPGCDPRPDTITVVVISEPPILTITPDAVICIGDNITLTASANSPGQFLWSPGGETTGTITVSPTETTVYSVDFISACYTLSGDVVVDVSPGFVVDSIVVTPPGEVFEGTPITLEAIITPPGLLEPLYIWFLGQDSIGSGVNLNPFLTEAPGVDEDGTIFQYSVLIIDAIGCQDTASIQILVKDSAFELPNAFTPDGDGVNDRFRLLKNQGVTIVEFRVFNRWGQMVYDNESGDAGWDGNYKGKQSPSDAYAYVILLRLGDGQEVLLKGEVTLLR